MATVNSFILVKKMKKYVQMDVYMKDFYEYVMILSEI